MQPEKQKVQRLVTKKSGIMEEQDPAKLRKRVTNLLFDLDTNYVDVEIVVREMMKGMYQGIKANEIDDLLAETCAYLNMLHPDYCKLAGRVAVSTLHKKTKSDFGDLAKDLYYYKDLAGRKAPLLSEKVFNIIQKNAKIIQEKIDYKRDYNYEFFGYKTLEKSYLLRLDKKIAERPQCMIMRVAIGIHQEDLKSAFETYDLISEGWFTHATPTLFNAGTPQPQCSSCFLLTMKGDSLTGIYNTLYDCAMISKSAGGIGISIHKIRASGSYIKGTNGHSNGIVPMLRVFNDTARYVDQGGGKRKGSIAVYLEPWHADIVDFLALKKNHGNEEARARDLFYALWIPDLFMQRVKEDGNWTLMCPNECPGLPDCYGEEFVKLYEKYEKAGRGRTTVKARTIWNEIVQSQIETGTPFVLYKDQANRKSNQRHLGTIRSSNLCTEIIEYTAPDETAVCNLASICLPKFVKNGKFDFDDLIRVVKVITKNLNKVIDINYYPVPEARKSNMRHRPIGIGVQGFADTLIKLRYPFESEEAIKVNEKIFAALYYGALEASIELAAIHGPYESYKGSPTSEGLLQFDLWNKKGHPDFDWAKIKKDMKKHGIRNSLLIAPMPTASTAQIMGNTECIDPIQANIYARRVLSGEFICINKHLVKDLIKLNLWNAKMKNKLIALNGSVQGIKEIPEKIQNLYKTTWEISQKQIIKLAASRAPYIDQSQSLNIHMEQPNLSKISAMHFFAWKSGLKTGMYYLRSRPATDPIKFTLDMEAIMKDSKNSTNDHAMQAMMFNKVKKKTRKVKRKVRVKRKKNPLKELATENTIVQEQKQEGKKGLKKVEELKDDEEMVEQEIEVEEAIKEAPAEVDTTNMPDWMIPCENCGS